MSDSPTSGRCRHSIKPPTMPCASCLLDSDEGASIHVTYYRLYEPVSHRRTVLKIIRDSLRPRGLR